MLKKLMTKKITAIEVGCIPVLLVGLVSGILYTSRWLGNQYYNWITDNLLLFFSIIILSLSPLFFSLLISIPAYFMRKEVHDYWFDRMMKVYMPIACVITFLMALAELGGGGGFGPQINGIGTLFVVFISSVLFILISIILITKKYAELKKRKK